MNVSDGRSKGQQKQTPWEQRANPSPKVREIAQSVSGDEGPNRWQSQAIAALQEATEAFLVHMFEDA